MHRDAVRTKGLTFMSTSTTACSPNEALKNEPQHYNRTACGQQMELPKVYLMVGYILLVGTSRYGYLKGHYAIFSSS